jgi:hypothetical protein
MSLPTLIPRRLGSISVAEAEGQEPAGDVPSANAPPVSLNSRKLSLQLFLLRLCDLHNCLLRLHLHATYKAVAARQQARRAKSADLTS